MDKIIFGIGLGITFIGCVSVFYINNLASCAIGIIGILLVAIGAEIEDSKYEDT